MGVSRGAGGAEKRAERALLDVIERAPFDRDPCLAPLHAAVLTKIEQATGLTINGDTIAKVNDALQKVQDGANTVQNDITDVRRVFAGHDLLPSPLPALATACPDHRLPPHHLCLPPHHRNPPAEHE